MVASLKGLFAAEVNKSQDQGKEVFKLPINVFS